MIDKNNVMEYLKELIEIRKNLINAIKAGMYDSVAACRELDLRWCVYRRPETFFGLETYVDSSMKSIWVDSLVFKYLEDFRVEKGTTFTYHCSIEVDGFTIYTCASDEELESWGVDIDRKRIS